MHPRRIEFRGAIGERRVFVLGAFGDGHKIGHLVK